MIAAPIARLMITLDEVEPTVMRRIEVPLSLRLDRLHLTLQAALGWTDSHLYQFRTAHGRWGVPDPEWEGGPADARKVTLSSIVEDMGSMTLRYLYDFGDGWEHTIIVEHLSDPLPEVLYPRLIEASGGCPPEDVGGPCSYADFLDALADPEHEQHADVRRWIGGDFDPQRVAVDQLASNVEKLAKKWARRPKPRKTLLH